MKKTVAIVAGVVSVGLATMALAQMGMGRGMMGNGGQGVSSVRHAYVMQHGIDRAYATANNPLKADANTLKTGRTLFEQNCQACHGASGRGDGPAARGLNPAPADLVTALHMPMTSDAYLDWTIAEGGTPVGSAMPPFKSVLSKDQIWTLVTYLRSLQAQRH